MALPDFDLFYRYRREDVGLMAQTGPARFMNAACRCGAINSR